MVQSKHPYTPYRKWTHLNADFNLDVMISNHCQLQNCCWLHDWKCLIAALINISIFFSDLIISHMYTDILLKVISSHWRCQVWNPGNGSWSSYCPLKGGFGIRTSFPIFNGLARPIQISSQSPKSQFLPKPPGSDLGRKVYKDDQLPVELEPSWKSSTN